MRDGTHESSTGRRHVVAMLTADPAAIVELAVSNAIFAEPRSAEIRKLGASFWYEVRTCRIARLNDVAKLLDGWFVAIRGLEQLDDADTIVVAASPGVPVDAPSAVRRALRDAEARGCRIVGIGSGVLLLAAAGLLTGRRATTHWSVVEELRHRYPEVLVENGLLYVADGQIYTSAGAAATLDLCLELVRTDHGVAVANALARWMVAPPHRSGDLMQPATTPLAGPSDGIDRLLDWASERLEQPLTLADLAQVAGVSQRTVIRRFRAALGTTPLQWLLTQRIRLARELLESTEYSIEQVAELSGLGTPGNFRQQFLRTCGVSPLRYRKGFRGQGGLDRRISCAGAGHCVEQYHD